MDTRRQFLVGFAGAGVIATTSRSVFGQSEEKQLDSKLSLELVGEFVGKSHGDIERVQALLKDEPALVNASWDWVAGDFETGLNAASHVGRQDIAELLLENGARLDVCAAVMLGMKGVVAAMLKTSTELHAVQGAHGIPLLSHAIVGGRNADDVFEMLLAAGADVNAKSNRDMTPLMAAASAGRVSQVEVLLAKGADPTVEDFKGRTALDMAKKREKFKAAKMLQRAIEG